MSYQLKKQPSGALALHDPETGETMHPGLGPWEEANRLYVKYSGLPELLAAPPPVGGKEQALVLFDVGLGAAANALAAIECREQVLRERGKARPLRLVSFENDQAPLRFAMENSSRLGYLRGQGEKLTSLLQDGVWQGGEGMKWELRLGDFTRLVHQEGLRADVIFFDPFSVRTNPAMWSLPTLEGLFRCRRPGDPTRLVTYSTAFGVRAALLLAGFFVGEAGSSRGEKRRGPAGGFPGRSPGLFQHRETGTVAATYFSLLEKPLELNWLSRWKKDRQPWPSLSSPKDHKHFREALAEHPQWSQFQAQAPSRSTKRGGEKRKNSLKRKYLLEK